MNRAYRFLPVLLVGALVACEDSTGPGDGDPPVLPAEESMSVELDFFDAPPAQATLSGPARAPEANWLAAALSVTAANVSVAIHSFVPRVIWAAALTQPPTFEDGRWHWRFDATHGADTFQGHVIGYQEDGNRIFEVRVSSSALQLDDVLFYTGTAPVGGTTGSWVFNDLEGSGPVARVDWSHPETDRWILSFTALAGNADGDVLAYDVNGTARDVSYSDDSEGTEVVVEWDALTREGSITAPNFNGGQRACWDGELHNVVCP